MGTIVDTSKHKNAEKVDERIFQVNSTRCFV